MNRAANGPSQDEADAAILSVDIDDVAIEVAASGVGEAQPAAGPRPRPRQLVARVAPRTGCVAGLAPVDLRFEARSIRHDEDRGADVTKALTLAHIKEQDLSKNAALRPLGLEKYLHEGH